MASTACCSEIVFWGPGRICLSVLNLTCRMGSTPGSGWWMVDVGCDGFDDDG